MAIRLYYASVVQDDGAVVPLQDSVCNDPIQMGKFVQRWMIENGSPLMRVITPHEHWRDNVNHEFAFVYDREMTEGVTTEELIEQYRRGLSTPMLIVTEVNYLSGSNSL